MKTDIQDTTLKARKEIIEEGIVRNQKYRILDVLSDDVGYSLQEIHFLTGFGINAVSGRVNDLKKDNLAETRGKRACSITGRTVRPVYRKTHIKTSLFS